MLHLSSAAQTGGRNEIPKHRYKLQEVLIVGITVSIFRRVRREDDEWVTCFIFQKILLCPQPARLHPNTATQVECMPILILQVQHTNMCIGLVVTLQRGGGLHRLSAPTHKLQTYCTKIDDYRSVDRDSPSGRKEPAWRGYTCGCVEYTGPIRHSRHKTIDLRAVV